MGKSNAECTTEELMAKAKTLKALLGVIAVLLLLAVGTVVYFVAKGSDINPALIGVFVAIMAGAIPSISGLAGIKKELKSRSE